MRRGGECAPFLNGQTSERERKRGGGEEGRRCGAAKVAWLPEVRPRAEKGHSPAAHTAESVQGKGAKQRMARKGGRGLPTSLPASNSARVHVIHHKATSGTSRRMPLT